MLRFFKKNAPSGPMDEERFWGIVESAKGDAGRVEAALLKLGATEIDAFDRIYWEKHNALHRWDVWGAAYVMAGGCSDDSFHYFKAWVIGKGRKAHAAAFADPDSLGPFVSKEDLENGFDNEALNYVSKNAYESKTGEEPEDRASEPAEPSGEAWDEETVSSQFPRLAKQFA